MNPISFLVAALVLVSGAACAHTPVPAPVQVQGAWVRPTVAGQQGTGAYMKLRAAQATRLVGVSTPAAGIAELHDMKLEGDVMTMRAVEALELPAGKTVTLKPGGIHLMLMDLKQPLPKNSTVPLTLLFRDAQGVQTRLELTVPVGTPSPAGPAGRELLGSKR